MSLWFLFQNLRRRVDAGNISPECLAIWVLFQKLRHRVDVGDISPEELVENLETHPDVKALWEQRRRADDAHLDSPGDDIRGH